MELHYGLDKSDIDIKVLVRLYNERKRKINFLLQKGKSY